MTLAASRPGALDAVVDHLLEHATLPVATFDEALICTRCNAAFAVLVGSHVNPVGVALPRLAEAEGGGQISGPHLGARLVRLQFGDPQHGTELLAAHMVRHDGGYALIGDRGTLADRDLATQMSRLHEQMINLSRELHAKNAELERAASEIRVLEGLLPICCECKKIRDDAGDWTQLELYLSHHSEAQFSHGYCPDCEARLYAELDAEEQRR